jgi:hypothetical protein
MFEVLQSGVGVGVGLLYVLLFVIYVLWFGFTLYAGPGSYGYARFHAQLGVGRDLGLPLENHFGPGAGPCQACISGPVVASREPLIFELLAVSLWSVLPSSHCQFRCFC